MPISQDIHSEHRHLLDQLQAVARGLGETFAPFCEVVVHDLTESHRSILAIHNNLSGRRVGDPTTELGNQRIADPDFPGRIHQHIPQTTFTVELAEQEDFDLRSGLFLDQLYDFIVVDGTDLLGVAKIANQALMAGKDEAAIVEQLIHLIAINTYRGEGMALAHLETWHPQ